MPPLLAAAKAGDLPAIKRLLDKPGADVDEADAAAGGERALHLAAEGGHADVVAELLDRGADINGMNNERWVALYCAAQSEAERSTHTVPLLLS